MRGLHHHRIEENLRIKANSNGSSMLFSSKIDLEEAFYAEWKDSEKEIVETLVKPKSQSRSIRDRVVAATIIQWLGSPVGFAFLEKVLERCGFVVMKKSTLTAAKKFGI